MKDRIRCLRAKNGWTALLLSRLLGVTERTIQRWERGDTQPNPLHLEKLEKLLKIERWKTVRRTQDEG
jgi:ribosome-binding protein aMBF1 (putative translation factor)